MIRFNRPHTLFFREVIKFQIMGADLVLRHSILCFKLDFSFIKIDQWYSV